MKDLKDLTPKEARDLIRENKLNIPTSGISKGHIQGNLAILPKELALDFLIFAQRNPKSCPILDVTNIGDPEAKLVAKGSDLRFDIPKYRIYKKGVLVDEVDNIEEYWNEDMVAFVIGCSFSFESAMLDAGLPVRHIEENHNVPMYLTNIETIPSGIFHGNTVVSMRPIPYNQVVKATTVTARFPSVHGAPLHIGNPEFIGINDINKPDFGDASTIKDGEIPVFWACGVTPQSIAMTSKPDIMITHSPGYMFICDPVDEDYSVL